MLPQEEYDKLILELTTRTEITKDEIFDFWYTPHQDACSWLYYFFQTSFNKDFSQFNILPAYFFFANSTKVNGWAWGNNNHNIVAVNIGTILRLNELFYSDEDIFANVQNRPSLFDLESQIDVTLRDILWQSAIMFIYYHEVGHLVHFDKNCDTIYSEDPEDKTDYSQEKHTNEADADSFAGVQLARHALKYWHKLSDENKSVESLSNIVALICTGSTIFKLHFIEYSAEFYTKKLTHPHSLVRLMIILDTITGYVMHIEKKLKKNQFVRKSFVENTIKLLDESLPNILGHEARKNLMLQYRENENDVFEYAQELINLIGDNPKSARNQFNKLARSS